MDLDHTRANRFPEDYDTDLESEWARSRKMATLLSPSNHRSPLVVIFRFVCRWYRLLLGHNSERSKSVLSETNSRSHTKPSVANGRLAEIGSEPPFEYRANRHYEHVIRVHVREDAVFAIDREYAYSTDW